MPGRKRLLITVQPAQVTAGSSGFANTDPLRSAIYLDSVIIETDTPSGLVLVNFGVSPGPVTSTALANAAQSAFDDSGTAINLTDGQAIPLPNGSAYLTGLSWMIPNGFARLFVQVINNQASDATRCHVIFQGWYLSEEEYNALASFPLVPPNPSEAPPLGSMTGLRPTTPTPP